jgi:hypothetical protein
VKRYTPGLLREIAEVFGDARALRLALTYGGETIWIPRRAREDHRLARALGADMLRWLVANYGNEEIVVPSGARSVLAEQLALVHRLVEQGLPANEIVRQARVNIRTVYRARARLREHDQHDLFTPRPPQARCAGDAA